MAVSTTGALGLPCTCYCAGTSCKACTSCFQETDIDMKSGSSSQDRKHKAEPSAEAVAAKKKKREEAVSAAKARYLARKQARS